jgi:hypothetical protein
MYINNNPSTATPLSNTAFWQPIVGTTQPPQWDDTVAYVPGNLVVGDFGNIYICKTANTNSNPTPTNNKWIILAGGLNQPAVANVDANGKNVITNRGVYSVNNSYHLGDYVITAPNAGSRHIEEYNESDFLLLGIPTNFG